MTYGFPVLGRDYKLLAYSSNQLRSASAWFVAEFERQVSNSSPCFAATCLMFFLRLAWT
jgi:hypothetical protein